jgi:hypothetical protein
MKRALALLAGILLVSQVAAQPAAAAEGAERTPGGPNPAGSVTAGKLPNMKVEFVSGWWVGTERHSQFKVSNIGDYKATNVSLRKIRDIHRPGDGDVEQVIDYQSLGDVPAGAFQFYEVVCTPKTNWYCVENAMKALTTGSDSDMSNNYAEDDF